MQTRILAALLCGCAGAGIALADTVVINDQVQVRESKVETPKRGLTMDDVEKHFGAPLTRHPTVGGGSKQRPPITRWDYTSFSVFFEGDKVIDSVVRTGETPPAPAAASAPAPSAASTPAPAAVSAPTPSTEPAPTPPVASAPRPSG
jgi:hypothetical protein